MQRRRLILLGAVALVLGALTPMLASASEYEQLGTVEEGVHEVTSDEGRLRVAAQDPVDLVVRTPDGDLVTARALDAGDQRTVVLEGTEAVVAVAGGEAEIEAEGEGDVEALDAPRSTVTLADADGEPVEESLTVQVPESVLIATAELSGSAYRLSVGATDGDDRVLDATGEELDEGVTLAPTAYDARALDVHLQGERLDGTVELSFVTLTAEEVQPAGETTPTDEDGFNATADVHALHYQPVRFTVPEEGGNLTVDIDTGHVFDASLYTPNGTQVHHLHAGMDLAEFRNSCDELLECELGNREYRSMAPQTLDQRLEPGEYLLFVRSGAVSGTLTIEDADGDALLEDAQPANITAFEAYGDREVALDVPVLDVRRHWSQEAAVTPSVDVTVDDEQVFHYEALAETFGEATESEWSLTPSSLEAGIVQVDMYATPSESLQGDRGVVLVLPSS